jgi:hypothetical protein
MAQACNDELSAANRNTYSPSCSEQRTVVVARSGTFGELWREDTADRVEYVRPVGWIGMDVCVCVCVHARAHGTYWWQCPKQFQIH